jgi:hypothetical protein
MRRVVVCERRRAVPVNAAAAEQILALHVRRPRAGEGHAATETAGDRAELLDPRKDGADHRDEDDRGDDERGD